MNAHTGQSQSVARKDAAQVVGVVGAPLVLLIALSAKYAVMQTLGCRTGAASMLIHAIAVISLLACGGVAWASLASRRFRGRLSADQRSIATQAASVSRSGEVTSNVNDAIHDEASHEARVNDFRIVGVWMSALCALVIVAQWLPQFFLDRCAF